jgi:hypothetical protein
MRRLAHLSHPHPPSGGHRRSRRDDFREQQGAGQRAQPGWCAGNQQGGVADEHDAAAGGRSGLFECFPEVVQEPEVLLLDQQVPDTDGRGDGPLHDPDRRQGR